MTLDVYPTMQPKPTTQSARHAPIPFAPFATSGGGNSLPLVVFGVIALDHAYLQRSDKATQQRALSEQLDIAARMQLQLPLFLFVWNSCADFVGIIESYLTRRP